MAAALCGVGQTFLSAALSAVEVLAGTNSCPTGIVGPENFSPAGGVATGRNTCPTGSLGCANCGPSASAAAGGASGAENVGWAASSGRVADGGGAAAWGTAIGTNAT